MIERMAPSRGRGHFVPPMLLESTERLPDDPSRWLYELKLDGYRAIAFSRGRDVALRSRNDNDFTSRYPAILRGLKGLPADTIVDGEVVAFDADGRPSFNALQNATPSTPVVYYAFDLLMLRGRDLTAQPLTDRRALLEHDVLPRLGDPVRYTGDLVAPLRDLIASVQDSRLEGLVAKRRDSVYEPGERSGAWRKMRVSRGQEFVIGGYTIGTSAFDAIILGVYDGGTLRYVARTRNGFTPAVRASLYRRFRPLEVPVCPFVNLPETRRGRWGQGLTSEKMKACRWLKPVLVAQVTFVEWTADDHLRHARFVALRVDKPAQAVRRE